MSIAECEQEIRDPSIAGLITPTDLLVHPPCRRFRPHALELTRMRGRGGDDGVPSVTWGRGHPELIRSANY
jgi:hypothetical protein